MRLFLGATTPWSTFRVAIGLATSPSSKRLLSHTCTIALLEGAVACLCMGNLTGTGTRVISAAGTLVWIQKQENKQT